MKDLILCFLFLFVFSLDMNILFGQYEVGEEPSSYSEDSDTQDKKDSKEINNKLCPVDFKKITEENKHTYEYDGKIYNFNSALCIENFKKDPQKYLAEWEKKERLRKINIIYD